MQWTIIDKDGEPMNYNIDYLNIDQEYQTVVRKSTLVSGVTTTLHSNEKRMTISGWNRGRIGRWTRGLITWFDNLVFVSTDVVLVVRNDVEDS